MSQLCAPRLVTLLEHLPQLLLALAKVFNLDVDSSLCGSTAVRRGQSIPGPFPAYVLQGLVSDMCFRFYRVFKKGVAIDDDVLHSHHGLVSWSSILGVNFLGLELGIEMTPLTLKAQPGTVLVTYLHMSPGHGEIAGPHCVSSHAGLPLTGSRPGMVVISGKITYQVVTGALGSGKVGPLPPPLLYMDLLLELACDLRPAG